MTVRVARNQVSIADKIHLSIEVTAAEGVDVEMPQFGEQLSEFAIRDFKNYPAIPEEGSRRWRQEYVLDIYLAGTYTIEDLATKFTDHRGQESIEGKIAVDPIEIQVASLLEGEFDPQNFRDIKGPVELATPTDRTWLAWLAAIVTATVLIAAASWWLWRRSHQPQPEVTLPPHDWAFARLRQLEDEQLAAKGQIHEFYFRLSSILRVYIERRFQIRAPELTTQEFLAELKHSTTLRPQHQGPLSNFLQACDQVKFALHRPGQPEANRALQAARDFVGQTAPAPVLQEVAA